MMHMIETNNDGYIRDIVIDLKKRKQYRMISTTYDVILNFKLQ